MNVYVQTLGLQNTSFADTSGLSSQNISTAQELSLLSMNLYKEYPHIFDITKLTQFIGNNTGWRNNNPLVKEQGYKGGKHGFTFEADKTDVAFFEETIATGQKRMISYVLLGSTDIQSDIRTLRALAQQNLRFE
jgi:D-alanyl-D-alanine carboxypeptidase